MIEVFVKFGVHYFGPVLTAARWIKCSNRSDTNKLIKKQHVFFSLILSAESTGDMLGHTIV